jgi:hypothetical protein
MSGIKKVVLHSDKDIVEQAKAAEYALGHRTKDWSSLVGVRVNGRYYGIKFNRTSIAVYPQATEPVSPAPP